MAAITTVDAIKTGAGTTHTTRKIILRACFVLSAAWLGLMAFAPLAHAGDLPTFRLEMGNGRLNPARIVVPAHTRIKIDVRNTGKGAVEFESMELRKEKVLAPGSQSFVVIAPLDPGEYKFFDDFNHQAQGVIVAK